MSWSSDTGRRRDTWISWGWCKCLIPYKEPLCNWTVKVDFSPLLLILFVFISLSWNFFLFHLRIDWLYQKTICFYSVTSGVYFENSKELIFYLHDLFYTKDLHKNKQKTKSITPVLYRQRLWHRLHLKLDVSVPVSTMISSTCPLGGPLDLFIDTFSGKSWMLSMLRQFKSHLFYVFLTDIPVKMMSGVNCMTSQLFYE